MGKVAVSVNGRQYEISCDDGQESHVREIAAEVDARIVNLVSSLGQIGDARLLLMASLLLTDDLWNAEARVRSLEQGLMPGVPDVTNAADGETLHELARRIESIADRLNPT